MLVSKRRVIDCSYGAKFSPVLCQIVEVGLKMVEGSMGGGGRIGWLAEVWAPKMESPSPVFEL